MIWKKSKKYFQKKVAIDKAQNQSTARKIQLYNDWQIDKLVERMNNGETGVKPSTNMLMVDLSILNKPEVYRNYNRIVNSPYTSNDNLFKLLTKDKANANLNKIVEAEVERVANNIEYVEQVLKHYNIPQKMYEQYKAEQKANSMASRQKILNDIAIKANDLLVSEGINIPNMYNYRNIEATAENLLRQSQMQSKHEEINSINDNYESEGKEKPYKSKEWVWTGIGKTTRHASNHLQKRQLNEPFIIINDETLDIDELMYPSDPDGSPSNTFICYCEVEYLTVRI